MLDVLILAADPSTQHVAIGWIVAGCGSFFLGVGGFITGRYEHEDKHSIALAVCATIGLPAFLIGMRVATNIAVGVCFGMFLMLVPISIGGLLGKLAKCL